MFQRVFKEASKINFAVFLDNPKGEKNPPSYEGIGLKPTKK